MLDCDYNYRYERQKAREMYKCCSCSYMIHEGEDYYEINEAIFCEDCITILKKVAGEE